MRLTNEAALADATAWARGAVPGPTCATDRVTSSFPCSPPNSSSGRPASGNSSLLPAGFSRLTADACRVGPSRQEVSLCWWRRAGSGQHSRQKDVPM